jgi:hypothetical protein
MQGSMKMTVPPMARLASAGTLTMMGDAWSWHIMSGMAGLDKGLLSLCLPILVYR